MNDNKIKGIIKGQNGLGKIPIIGKLAKDAAYKIVSNKDVWRKGGASTKDIVKSIFSKGPEEIDPTKYMFIYGPDKLRKEVSDGEAYDWKEDIDYNGYKNVKSYEGIINPYNEYLMDARDRGLIEALSDKKFSTSSVTNEEYSYPGTHTIKENTPYFDDVHGYRIVFHRDGDKPVISASDLYDFGKEYANDFAHVYEKRGGTGNGEKRLEIQRKLLTSVGQPYKLVQKNIPIRFVENPKGEELERVNAFQPFKWWSDQQIADVLGHGLLEPAIVRPK